MLSKTITAYRYIHITNCVKSTQRLLLSSLNENHQEERRKAQTLTDEGLLKGCRSTHHAQLPFSLVPPPCSASLMAFAFSSLAMFLSLASILLRYRSILHWLEIIFVVDGVSFNTISYPSLMKSMPSVRSCQKRPPAVEPPVLADW